MFGQNQVYSPHAFDDAPKDSLLVSTVFFTLQGEGPFAGEPAIFIRLARCNLACSFCDARFDDGEYMTFSALATRVHEVRAAYYHEAKIPAPFYGGLPLVVLTGGEPLLQRQVAAFLRYIGSYGCQVQIESNGLFDRDLPDDAVLVVSPKCNERTKQYITPPQAVLDRANHLKFVVSATAEGYTDVPDFARLWQTRRSKYGESRVWVSPMNVYLADPPKAPPGASMADRSAAERVSFWTPGMLDLPACQANHEHAALLCMRHGYRLSLQQHLFASLP